MDQKLHIVEFGNKTPHYVLKGKNQKKQNKKKQQKNPPHHQQRCHNEYFLINI